jgi:hypothetical protein
VTFGTNAFNLGSAVISGGTWQGGTIQPAYGGTGLTTFVAADNALYSTGSTTLTAGTLPIVAGGTGATTAGGALTSLGAVNIAGDTMTGALAIDISSSTAALRVTQRGTGNALLVEDSTNPDSTPVVVDADGRVVVGTTASQNASYRLQSVGTNGGDLLTQRWAGASAGGSILRIQKSRGASIGTNGIVSSGDTIGTMWFDGDDGTKFVQAAAIVAAVDGTPGTNDMPGRLVFSTTADGASSPTERLRINSSGTTIASGEVQAPTVNATNGIFVNSATVTASYTVASGNNASSAGPLLVDSGVTVTVSSGGRWVIV